MVNDTQTVFQNCPVRPIGGVPDKIYLDKLGVYVNGQTAGTHRNECGVNLGYGYISDQLSMYDTQSGSTAFQCQQILVRLWYTQVVI